MKIQPEIAEKKRSYARQANRAFSLFEVLVAVSVMTVLASLLLISLSTTKEKARKIECMSHLNQIGLAVVLYGADNGVFVPCLTATSDWTYLLKPYLDKTGSVYSPPNERSPVIACPSRAIKLADLETTYAAHRKVLVNTQGPDFDTPRRISNLTRPTEIAILGDAMQLPGYGGGKCVAAYDFQHAADWTLTGIPADRDNVVDSANADADGVGENVRYRHEGSANLLFADGHVASYQPGELKERNVMVSY